MLLPPPTSTLFPYPTLFRSPNRHPPSIQYQSRRPYRCRLPIVDSRSVCSPKSESEACTDTDGGFDIRSEEHTSELQSRFELVCRRLLEKKKPQPRLSASQSP